MTSNQPAAISHRLLSLPPARLAASAHFLKNHDDRLVASVLLWPEHRAAALVVAGLTGLRFSTKASSPARGGKSACIWAASGGGTAAGNRLVVRYLLTALAVSAVGRGHGQLLAPRPAWPENPTSQNFVLLQWEDGAGEFDLVVVNLAPRQPVLRAAHR